MPIRVLVVQNYENTGLGQVETALARAGALVDLRRPFAGDALPSRAGEHDGAIVLGGGQNALADEDYPYFPALIDLLRDFARRDRAVLGICLGSQILARAFGGRNQIGGATEFGWKEIELTDAARSDPVLGSLPEHFPAFQWHDDSFSLPPGALHLARGGEVANQAFRIGRAVYGFQFHLEADLPTVRHWSAVFPDAIARIRPDWPARLGEEAARSAPGADAAGLAIATAWVCLM